MFDPGAILGFAGSAISGIMGSDSANSAADAQANAANQANATQRYIFDQQRKDQEPWRNVGNNALNMLAMYMGLKSGQAPVMPTREQFMTGGNGSGGGSGNIPTFTESQYAQARLHPDSPIARAIYAAKIKASYPGTDPSGGYSNGNQTFDAAGYNAAMAKYKQDLAAYNAQNGGSNFGKLLQGYDASKWQYNEPKFNFQADPGYQFRLSEGNKQIDRGQAARGNFYSGAALKEAQDFGQGLAAQEYANAYGRFTNDRNFGYNNFLNNRNFDYGVFNDNNANLFNRLSSMAGLGQQANQANAIAGTNYANNVSANQIGMGNVNASNAIAQGNAWNNVFNNGINAFGSMYKNYSLNNDVNNITNNRNLF